MIDFQALRNKILDKAIRGELVPQLENEPEVAKNGAEPEKAPFEIPKKWKWYSLGEVIDYGKAEQVGSSFVTDNTWVLDLEDIEKNTGRLLTKKRGLVSSSNKNIFKKGWVLYSKLRPYLNKVVIADEDGICTTEIVPINTNESKIPLLAGYLKAYLMSPYFLSYANQVAHGVKMPRIGTKDARTALIPIPPIEEQSRIIQKLSNSFKQIQCASEAYNELNTLSKNLKQQILLRAIQGRLVPQLESEPEVSLIGEPPANIPFAIPKKWKWVKLGNAFHLKTGKFISADRIKGSGAYPCYGGNGKRGYVNEFNRQGRFPLIGRQGALCGNINLVDGKFYATEHAVVADGGNLVDPDCAALFLESLNLNQYATKTAQPGLSVKRISETPYPLPPLAEQKRISNKIKNLFLILKQIDH